jgi:alkylhydroperoxidase family enzyme
MKSPAAERFEEVGLTDDLPEAVRRLLDTALRGPATTDPEKRRELFTRATALALGGETTKAEEQLDRYADKVALWAYKVLDEEVEGLREAGYSDDELFELTICSALGAGAVRFATGLRALKGAMKNADRNR